MDETNKPEQPQREKSAWDDLADQIGATPSPDATERKRPAVGNVYEPVERKHSAPVSRGGDWNALAEQLGVEMPEPPPAPIAATTTTSQQQAADVEPSPAEPTARDEKKRAPRESRRGRDQEKPQKTRDEGQESRAGKKGQEESLFVDLPTITGDDWTASAPTHDPATLDDAKSPISAKEQAGPSPTKSNQIDGDDAPTAETPANQELADQESAEGDLHGDEASEETSLTGDAARSAFDALFESGSFGSMEVPLDDSRTDAGSSQGASEATPTDPGPPPAADVKQPSRGGWFGFGRRKQKEADEAAEKTAPAPPQDAADEPEDWLGKSATDSAEMGPPVGEAAESSDEESAGEKTGRRRRRRRRRRSGTSEEQAKSEAIENGKPAEGADDDALDDDVDDDDEQTATESTSDSVSSRRRPIHKNIPTWFDAIGVMVEANMQARKQSRDRSSSRGGAGKGRGRGVRRRKKS